MLFTRIHQTLAIIVLVCFIGCAGSEQKNSQQENDSSETSIAQQDSASENKASENKTSENADSSPDVVTFKDEVESNVEVPKGLDELVFIDTQGQRVAIKDFVGKKNVVLVFTEGFNGMLCPFCKTQTSRLVANYPKFTAQDTEVLVVYPGTRDHLEEFMEAALTTEKTQVDAVPFPIVLDEDFKATNFFDIKSMHAHPSTYIIDKQGKICLAYVGADMTVDRPSVKAILSKLQAINK